MHVQMVLVQMVHLMLQKLMVQHLHLQQTLQPPPTSSQGLAQHIHQRAVGAHSEEQPFEQLEQKV